MSFPAPSPRKPQAPYVVLGLGSNLGARRALLACAWELLAGLEALEVLARSQLYETPALGPPQPAYLNAALRVAWRGSLSELLVQTQRIEHMLERTRAERWGPRTLDIDILYASEGSCSQPGLIVPHPALQARTFALAPLLDVAPELLSTYGRALTLAGGPPPAVQPWGELFTRYEGGLETTNCTSPTELWSAAATAGAALLWPRSFAATSVRPFVFAAAGLEAGCAELLHALDASARAGFGVRAAAVTDGDRGRARGVFVGAPMPCRAAPRCAFMLTRLSEGTTCASVFYRERSA